jgi:peptidyl-tRNA hydrolase, PTH1 family
MSRVQVPSPALKSESRSLIRVGFFLFIAMKLIVGLGNPGPEYANTRHNAGFMLIDWLARRFNVGTPGSERTRFHSLVLDGSILGEKVMLLKPQTYMNRSGLAVGEAMQFYKLATDDVMVLVDDIYLPTGKIRLRSDGGAGGHNGLKDIERALSGPVYPRMRIGVDAPGMQKQVDYVLGRFTPEQEPKLDDAMHLGCDAIVCWLKNGLPKAMSLYNSA